MGEVHVTAETIAILVGIFAVVAPGAYMAGRFNQRLTSVEKQIEILLERTLAAIERLAGSLDALVNAVRDVDRHALRSKFNVEDD